LKRSSLVFVTLTIIAFCFSSASAWGISLAAQERSAPERVSADTPRVTAGGTTFTVPSGWSIVTAKDLVVLETPEPDTHIAIFDAPAGDAASAVTAAWAAYKPESKRPVKLVTPRPAKEGWDERQIFDYETSPNERAAVEALALRAGAS